MFGLSKKLSQKKLESIYEEIDATEDVDEFLKIIEPLRAAQVQQKPAAHLLLRGLRRDLLSWEETRDILWEVYQSHSEDINIVSRIGDLLEEAKDIDDLNAPPPDHPVFESVVQSLSGWLCEDIDDSDEDSILFGLCTAARMMARQYDDEAFNAYRRRAELKPYSSDRQYGLGLQCKTRGAFEEGMEANRRAMELSEEIQEAVVWNFGICATAAGHGEAALENWGKLGFELEMGRFGLPEGRYQTAKICVAEFPLAERDKSNDYPGQTETIWVERLSPCHGIIRSVFYFDLGVNYGDVIVFDGAPMTYHVYGEDKVPVHPHLMTFRKENYLIFDFAGVQHQAGQLMGLSEHLTDDSIVYSHTEKTHILCNECWNNPDRNHEHHREKEVKIVTGKIAFHPNLTPSHILSEIDNAISDIEGCEIYAPYLCRAAGQVARASVEQRRYDLIAN